MYVGGVSQGSPPGRAEGSELCRLRLLGQVRGRRKRAGILEEKEDRTTVIGCSLTEQQTERLVGVLSNLQLSQTKLLSTSRVHASNKYAALCEPVTLLRREGRMKKRTSRDWAFIHFLIQSTECFYPVELKELGSEAQGRRTRNSK